MSEQSKAYFDVVGYIDKKRKKIGYAYETDKGSLCIKGDELIGSAQLGRLMKKGIYIQKRLKIKQ